MIRASDYRRCPALVRWSLRPMWGLVAFSIVAGLGVASILTLFVIPVLYHLFMQRHGGALIRYDTLDVLEYYLL